MGGAPPQGVPLADESWSSDVIDLARPRQRGLRDVQRHRDDRHPIVLYGQAERSGTKIQPGEPRQPVRFADDAQLPDLSLEAIFENGAVDDAGALTQAPGFPQAGDDENTRPFEDVGGAGHAPDVREMRKDVIEEMGPITGHEP